MPTEKRERQRAARQARREAELAAQQRSARRRQITLTTLAVAGIVGLLFLFGVLGGGDDSETVSTDKSTTTTTEKADSDSTTTTGPPSMVSVPPGETVIGPTVCPRADGGSERATKFEQPPPMCIDKNKTYKATVETDVGTFVVQFDAKAAPKTVNNFVVLARYHYFDGIVFHRVIKDFVIQGGDPTGTGTGDPGYKFADENLARTKYAAGDLAMANSGDNTNGSQFFVVLSENGAKTLIEAQPDKKPHYTRFGRVIEGLDVVKQIEADGADAGTPGGTPAVLHRMKKVTIEES